MPASNSRRMSPHCMNTAKQHFYSFSDCIIGKFNRGAQNNPESVPKQITEKGNAKLKKMQSYYQNKNFSGSASSGRYFSQVRKIQTVKAFEKHLKEQERNETETGTSSSWGGNRDGFRDSARLPLAPPKVYDSLQAKKKKLNEAEAELRKKWHQNKLDAAKRAEEREQKQKLWLEKKKKRGQINRLMNKKTSRGQPSMKALSKALLMKIEQRMNK